MFLQEWALTKTNFVRHRDMCLTLKDSAPGKPVAIEGCRDNDNKQVGCPVAVKFLSTVFDGNARLIFILSIITYFSEWHSLLISNKTIRNRDG